MVLLAHATVDADSPLGKADYPPVPHRGKAVLARADRLAEAAREWAPLDSTVTWAAGRVALASGDPGRAAKTLAALKLDAGRNPFLLVDLMEAACRAGLVDDAVAAFERSSPENPSPLLRDEAVGAYLAKARSASAPPLQVFQRVLELRPGDLSALLHLWASAPDATSRLRFQQLLTRFPLDAVEPKTRMLGEYTAEAIVGLEAEGAWSSVLVRDVVATLVWRHPEKPWVGRLLEALCLRRPEDPFWRFYLAEWHQRRGELPEAVNEYETVVRGAPQYARAYERLAMIHAVLAEVGGDARQFEKACTYFVDYARLVPPDSLALRKLIDVGHRLDHVLPSSIGSGWQTAAADGAAVSLLVGPVASRDITLGPNLVASGNFRGWDDQRTAPGWAWIDQATGGKSNRALFVAAPDNLEPWAGPSIRISGLWRDADSAGATAAFGARAPALSLEPRSAYLAACYYRTERVPDDGANVYVSDDPMRLVPGGDIRLPATGGRWRRVVVLVP
ncbi:MAG: hypothetical protein ACM3NQ_20845, partial [Bacteroidales bacterium]